MPEPILRARSGPRAADVLNICALMKPECSAQGNWRHSQKLPLAKGSSHRAEAPNHALRAFIFCGLARKFHLRLPVHLALFWTHERPAENHAIQTPRQHGAHKQHEAPSKWCVCSAQPVSSIHRSASASLASTRTCSRGFDHESSTPLQDAIVDGNARRQCRALLTPQRNVGGRQMRHKHARSIRLYARRCIPDHTEPGSVEFLKTAHAGGASWSITTVRPVLTIPPPGRDHHRRWSQASCA